MATTASAHEPSYFIRGDSGPVVFYDLFGNPNGGRVEGNFSSTQVGPPAFIISPDLSPAEAMRRAQSAASYARSGQGVVDVYTQQNGRVIWAGHGANPMPEQGGYLRVFCSKQPDVLTPGASYTGNVFPKDHIAILSPKVQAWGYSPTPPKNGAYPEGSASVLGPSHPVTQARGGHFQPSFTGPVPRMPLTCGQRAQVGYDTGMRMLGGAGIVVFGMGTMYEAGTNTEMDPAERYVLGSTGATATLAGSSYTLLVAGQGMTAAGYAGSGAALTTGGVAVGTAATTTAAATATFAVSYTATRGIDYATGNRISTGLATGFWATYETIAAPYNLWNGNDVYGRTSTAADMTYHGANGDNFWGY